MEKKIGLKHLSTIDDYYPFGMAFETPNEVKGSPPHKYLYQGKEYQNELGLDMYDFHARMYDPQLGRWHAPDPLSQFHSPYNYAANNPVNVIDPSGMWAFDFKPDRPEPLPWKPREEEKSFWDETNGSRSRSAKDGFDNGGDNSKWPMPDNGLSPIWAKGGKNKGNGGKGNEKPCKDCPSGKKNRDIFTSEDGNDYIFFDNSWHKIGKEKFETVRVFDGSEYVEVQICRVKLFETNYVWEKQVIAGAIGSVGGGSAGSLYQHLKKGLKSLSLEMAIIVGSQSVFSTTKRIYREMRIHDNAIDGAKKTP
jgi:RHS repeat-associated protein